MPRVLHLTRDYPDQIYNGKTKAVSNLIENSSGFCHYVFSLNRTSNIMDETVLNDGDNIYAIAYFGMPYAIMLNYLLVRTARKLHEIIIRENIAPDIIHSHKLTYEGIVALYLSKRLNIPFVCSIRGDTDLKLIKYKPIYHYIFRRILDNAQHVFFIAPWTLDKIAKWAGSEIVEKSSILPNIVNISFDKCDNRSELRAVSNRFVTVCNLDVYKRKNIRRIIMAVDQCISDGYDIYLDIIGGGSTTAIGFIEKAIDRCVHRDRIDLKGSMDNSLVVSSLKHYAGLVLPSYPETFGMVYLEALQAGIPFINSSGAGVDGYFSDCNVSVSVDPKSVESIKIGIKKIYSDQQGYKENIFGLTQQDYFSKFSTKRIIQDYEKAITQAISNTL